MQPSVLDTWSVIACITVPISASGAEHLRGLIGRELDEAVHRLSELLGPAVTIGLEQ